MSTQVGPCSRQRPRVSYSLGMRLKKAVTNSIQEEVMLTYSIPKRYDLEGFRHGHVTEMRVDKVRVDGRSTVELPTFSNDVGID